MEKRIYVLRSADETYTKIGVSQDPNSRVDIVSKEAGKDYYIVFTSKFLDPYEAVSIESALKTKYKDKTVFQTEHFDIHPLILINEIVEIIGTPKKQDDLYRLTNFSKYPCWIEKSGAKYNRLNNFHKEGIKIANDYSAYIKLLYNSRMVTVGFANIGDAERFASRYKHSIRAIDKITKLLYNKEHDEWARELFENPSKTPYKKWFFM